MPKIAFLFPGQGAQSVGMCRELDQELPAVRGLFDRAGEFLGIDLRHLCIEGPAEALEATDVSQPAIFVASLAALESLKASNPDLVASAEAAAGLSLGEYTALMFAGAIGIRGRAPGRPPTRSGDAGRRPGHAQRHDQRPRPRRAGCRRALPARRPCGTTVEGQPARAGQYRRLRREARPWSKLPRWPPSSVP